MAVGTQLNGHPLLLPNPVTVQEASCCDFALLNTAKTKEASRMFLFAAERHKLGGSGKPRCRRPSGGMGS